MDRASTGLPEPSVAAPAASPSGSAAPRGGPVGGCSAGSASVLLQRLVLLRTLGCCSSNGVGGKRKRGLQAQVCTAVGAREGALGNGCGQRAAAENWIYVSDQHRTKGALGLSDHLPLSLRPFSLSLSFLYLFCRLLIFLSLDFCLKQNSCQEQKNLGRCCTYSPKIDRCSVL